MTNPKSQSKQSVNPNPPVEKWEEVVKISKEYDFVGAFGVIMAKELMMDISSQIKEAFMNGYKKGVKDEIECVETSGEHLGLQKKLQSEIEEKK